MPNQRPPKLTPITFCALTLSTLMFALVALSGNMDRLLQIASERYGQIGRDTVSEWRELLGTSREHPPLTQLSLVNDFFNNTIFFSNDAEIWGEKDYWATPLETMGRRKGDCEDFSIAKYITLLKLGVPLEQLRLVYVKAHIDGRVQAHMVLAYYETPSSDPLILDNLSIEIRPASRRPDLTPVFSFNSAGLWVGNAAQPKVKKPETRLSRWRDVLTRMQAEGLQ